MLYSAVGPIQDLYRAVASPLRAFTDPLTFDLDGDGIELSALGVSGQTGASTVFFDFDGDGFRERTGWVKADDGMLALDRNGNGTIDNGLELFGQPLRDGYEVLETLDTFADGVIDEKDAAFAALRIWRDLDQDGVSDPGELQTLAQAGITSISLTRTNVTGTNQGHDRGFEGGFTRTNGTTGTAETIYFQTDRQNTLGDNTPGFTPAAELDQLPQLPGSGQINSVAWKATQDAAFRTAWTQLTDQAATLSHSDLRDRFEALLLQWAGVDGLPREGRGQYVDGRHLGFVEKFFGQDYQELRATNDPTVLATSPSTSNLGAAIEANFDAIVDVMMTAFLAQTTFSIIQRGGAFEAALSSPYLFYALIDFRTEIPAGETPSPTPGNLGAILDLVQSTAPTPFGQAVAWYEAALTGLKGAASFAFNNDAAAFAVFTTPYFTDIADPVLRQLATAYASGTALIGTSANDGFGGTAGSDVLSGGKGDDLIVGGEGSDLYVYARGDGNDWIVDDGIAPGEIDVLILRDLNRADVSFSRDGNALIVTVTTTGHTITIAEAFAISTGSGERREGVETIRFSDGTTISRDDAAREAIAGGPLSEFGVGLTGGAGNDVLRGGVTNDVYSNLGNGTDVVMFGRGDGHDIVEDLSQPADGRTIVQLVDLRPDDVEIFLDNSGDSKSLLIRIISTGETLRDRWFAWETDISNGIGIDGIKFANGVEWSRATIISQLEIQGGDGADRITDTKLNDTIVGGKGHDSIILSGLGADRVVWRPGDGHDTITRNGSQSYNEVDRLVLANTRPSDVLFTHNGFDVQITHKTTQEVITLSFYAWDASATTGFITSQYSMPIIEFGDGSIFTPSAVANKIGEDFRGWVQSPTSLIINGFVIYSYTTDEYGNVTGIEGATPPYTAVNHFSASEYIKRLAPTSGHDFLYAVSETLLGGDGNDYISGFYAMPWASGNERLEGGAGNDTIEGGDGNDTLLGDSGSDYIYGGIGNDVIRGGAHRDNLIGGAGNDFLDGGAGDDVLGDLGDSGSNTYRWGTGSGNDVIVAPYAEAGEVRTVEFVDTSGNVVGIPNLIFTRNVRDLVITHAATGETLTIVDQFAAVGAETTGGNVIQFFGTLTAAQILDRLVYKGTTGNDSVDSSGRAFNDRFELGRGHDVMLGGDGSDTYVISRGDGRDTIIESIGLASDMDRIVFTDVASTGVTFERTPNDLIIRVNGVDQSILVSDHFLSTFSTSPDRGIELFQFSDGVTLSRSAVTGLAWYRGTDGRDYISSALNQSATIQGGLGDDTIVGGNEPDLFIYRRGDGQDLYSISGATGYVDWLQLRGIDKNDVRLSMVENQSLQIVFAGYDGSLTISGYQLGASSLAGIRFDDGTEWNRADITFWSGPGSVVYLGTIGDDAITGSFLNQRLSGERGNDTIDGGTGSDTIFGDADNDTIRLSTSLAGDRDSIDGGTGVDTLDFTAFSAAILVDLVNNQGEALTRDNAELLTGTWRTIADIRLVENVTGSAFNDDIAADGAANLLLGGNGNDRIDGRSGADTLDGGIGNDTLFGGLDNDLLIGGLGADSIDGGVGTDTVTYEASNAAVSVILGGASTGGHAQGDVIINVEHVIGSTFADTITGDGAANQITGGAGNDTLAGGAGNDIFLVGAGAGRDSVDGGLGQDEIRATATGVAIGFSAIAGIETISAGGFANVTVAGDATANVINLTGVTLSGIAKIDGGAGNDTITGTTGADTIDGSTGSDSMIGGLGADIYIVDAAGDIIVEVAGGGADEVRTSIATYTLSAEVERLVYTGTAAFTGTGNAQNNTLTGGVGADRLNGGAGADRLIGGAGNDILVGGIGDDVYIVDSGTDTITEAAGEGTDLVETNLASFTLAANVENLRAIGTVALAGTGNALTNVITGANANDTLTGGLEADTLDGGAGSDIYVYASGDGADKIDENNGSTTDVDRLRLTNLTAADVTLSSSGSDLLVQVNATNQVIEIDEHFWSTTSNWGIEEIEFSNGTVWGLGRINAVANGLALTLGTANADTLTGSAGANAIFSEAGNDVVNAGAGDDTVGGGDGNDTLNGQAGSDFVYGENGNDTLRINSSIAGELDILDGGAGIDTLDLNGFSFAAWVDLASDTEVWTRDASNVTSGTWRTVAEVVSIENLAGTAFADELFGNAVANQLAGGAGADQLDGRDGDDVLIGGAGADTLTGGAGVDTASYAGTSAIVLDRVTTGNSTGDAAGDLFNQIERFALTSNADRIVGSNDAETVDGGAGNDTLLGGGGADSLIGGAGTDSLAGGVGNDIYVVDAAGDIVTDLAGEGVDLVQSSVTWTLGTNTENLLLTGAAVINGTGNALGNSVTGNTGANRLDGLAGTDTLDGGGGADTLDGGADNDQLMGGIGNDAFVFASGFGRDVITDFTAGTGIADVIQFSGLGTSFDTFAEVLAVSVQVSANTVISIDANNTVTLNNVSRTALVADDFLFT